MYQKVKAVRPKAFGIPHCKKILVEVDANIRKKNKLSCFQKVEHRAMKIISIVLLSHKMPRSGKEHTSACFQNLVSLQN